MVILIRSRGSAPPNLGLQKEEKFTDLCGLGGSYERDAKDAEGRI
jgi:hypothetical protein